MQQNLTFENISSDDDKDNSSLKIHETQEVLFFSPGKNNDVERLFIRLL